MGGIFGFILKKPLSINEIFRVLSTLEKSQAPGESEPIGGYGAGLAVMLRDGNIISEKVGKNSGSPVDQLEGLIKSRLGEASVALGHVRMANREQMSTIKYKEAAQPYIEHFDPNLTVASAHNGKVENWRELKGILKGHVFESDSIGFVDSEVIPHYFDELLNETRDPNLALYELMCNLEGSNLVALLQIDSDNAFIHLIHKGKTNGLHIWTNDRGEVIFCSRSGPVTSNLKTTIAVGRFEQKAIIRSQENAGLKFSFPIQFS